MPKFNEVLKSMVEGSGLSSDDTTIKSILENPAFASIDVADEISTRLTAPRLTMDAAKNNPDLHNHFKALTLNGLDKKVKESAKSFGLSEDEINELESEKSSYERAIKLAEKVRNLEAKKQVAPDEQKKIFTKEIEGLNNQIVGLKNSFEQEKNSLLTSFENEKLNWRMDSVYSEYIPQMNKDLKPNINLTIAKQTVSEAMQGKGYKIVNKEGNLTLQTAEGNDVYENNQKLTLKDFVSKTLANEKLLTASKSNQQTQTTKTKYTPITTTSKGDKNASSFLSKIAELSED